MNLHHLDTLLDVLTLPEDGNVATLDVSIRASLDRIDSSKPYEVGNIQFISTPINYMKNSMSDEQTKTYLRVISANIIDSWLTSKVSFYSLSGPGENRTLVQTKSNNRILRVSLFYYISCWVQHVDSFTKKPSVNSPITSPRKATT